MTAEPGQAEPGAVERGAGDRGRERAVAAPEDRGAAVPRDEALAVAGRCALRDAAARAGRQREGARCRRHGCGAAACALEPGADGRVAWVTARTSRWTGHRAISYRQKCRALLCRTGPAAVTPGRPQRPARRPP